MCQCNNFGKIHEAFLSSFDNIFSQIKKRLERDLNSCRQSEGVVYVLAKIDVKTAEEKQQRIKKCESIKRNLYEVNKD